MAAYLEAAYLKVGTYLEAAYLKAPCLEAPYLVAPCLEVVVPRGGAVPGGAIP